MCQIGLKQLSTLFVEPSQSMDDLYKQICSPLIEIRVDAYIIRTIH